MATRTATGFWKAISRAFMAALLNLPQVRGLLSDQHFSVGGTLIEVWGVDDGAFTARMARMSRHQPAEIPPRRSLRPAPETCPAEG